MIHLRAWRFGATRNFAACCALALATASCSTLDGKIAAINSSVSNYCAVIEAAGQIALALDNKPVVNKINVGLSTYCDPAKPVTDVPTALVKLAQIYRDVNNAGISVAKD